MKKLNAIIAALVLIGASLQVKAQTPPPDTGSFITTVGQWFTSFNPNLTNTLTAKATLWTGVNSIQGGEASLANEVGLAYSLGKSFGVETIMRDSGIAGTLLSQQIGLNYNINVIDMRLTGYLDGGYTFANDTGKKFYDSLFGEAGLRVQKALTEHTFAYIGMGVQFPKGTRVFQAGAGFTF